MVVELVLVLISSLWLMQPSAAAPPMAKLGCNDSCGGVTIPYPFGIGPEQCYLEKGFEITCNESANNPPKPFLTQFELEVLSISLDNQNVIVIVPVVDICTGSPWTSADLTGSPFLFSASNLFIVMGCGNALLTNQSGAIVGGCTATCNSSIIIDPDGCYGIDCCQVSIPSGHTIFNIITTTEECTPSFLWYSDRSSNILGNFSNSSTPVLLDWMIKRPDLFPRERLSSTWTDANGSVTSYGYSCPSYYEGNPYISNGCEVVEGCRACKLGRCVGNYTLTSNGTYDYVYNCDNRKSLKAVILGVSISGGSLFILLGGFWLYTIIMRKVRRKEMFFKRNGGLLLQQQMKSDKGVVEKTRIFTSQELKKATDNFNNNRILGQGGQGTVYKGMLTNGEIVAIKKSKIVDESQLEHFINEVVILSQINHRNVVKLLGCCLETEVPLLVYEFIPNGTLFELIHDPNEVFPLSWEMRLQIATEVAGVFAYLHSTSSMPIYHRDIKSTNILLDDKYRAKVSDFGTSRSVSIDQTHLSTLVQGTFGYLDPEYFQSSQFTEKSDVYSFGVVLVELLTGLEPISSMRSQEVKSLAAHFIVSFEENRLFNILDARVIKEGGKMKIMAFSNLAKRCLDWNGKKRPTMKEVTAELEGIRMSCMPMASQQNFQEGGCSAEIKGPHNGLLTSIMSSLDYTQAAFSVEVQPLVHNSI